jgi:transcriptional regulator with XRE-family HTH domain/quercetin dioxygenase-like cupin family protein
VTASLLSQIENGKSDPSVSTLSALVSELGLSLDALLRSEWPGLDDRLAPLDDRAALDDRYDGDHGYDAGHPGAGDHEDGNGRDHRPVRLDGATELGSRPRRRISPVIRPAERQTLDLDSGVVWERLTRGPSELMDALLVTYEPGASSSSSGKLLRHNGIERAYLMSGELTLQLGFESYRLRAGDSLEFDAANPHVYCNQADVPARGLWFVLGRENLPIQSPAHRLLDLAEPAPHDMLSAVDFLEAFSRD